MRRSNFALRLQPSLLEEARRVAEHLVLNANGIDFAPHPVVTDTDRDKYCVLRIVESDLAVPTRARPGGTIERIAFEAALRTPEALGQIFSMFVITVAAAYEIRPQSAAQRVVAAEPLDELGGDVVESGHQCSPRQEARTLRAIRPLLRRQLLAKPSKEPRYDVHGQAIGGGHGLLYGPLDQSAQSRIGA